MQIEIDRKMGGYACPAVRWLCGSRRGESVQAAAEAAAEIKRLAKGGREGENKGRRGGGERRKGMRAVCESARLPVPDALCMPVGSKRRQRLGATRAEERRGEKGGAESSKAAEANQQPLLVSSPHALIAKHKSGHTQTQRRRNRSI
jgi:hypothetical protein